MIHTLGRITVASALALSTTLCAQQPTREPTATLRVQVLDSASGRRVVGADMEVQSLVRTTRTDSTGRAVFIEVPLTAELLVRCPSKIRPQGPIEHRRTLALRPGVNTLIIRIDLNRCKERPASAQKDVILAGHYTRGHEEMTFRPCDADVLNGLTYFHRAEPGDVAWVTFRSGFSQTILWPASPDSASRRRRFVRWRGTLTGPGRYGGGFATHEFVVDSILDVRVPLPSDCTSPPRARPGFIAELEATTAPLDSMESRLRPLAGTAAADSAFRILHNALRAFVATIARTFTDSAFQVAVDPDGALAQQLRRHEGRPMSEADSGDRATADSLLSLLDRRGVRIVRGEEGGAYFDLSEQELFGRAGKYVTTPLRELLQLSAEEEARPTGADGSIMIPWDELGSRVAVRESWALRNPGYPEADEVSRYSRRLLRLFIRGTDNTDVFDWRTKVMPLKYRAAYRSYVAAHPDTDSGKLVAEYLRALEADDWRERANVQAFIAKHDAILSWRH